MEFLRTEARDGAVDMMRAIKRALDPDNITQPGQDFFAVKHAARSAGHTHGPC